MKTLIALLAVTLLTGCSTTVFESGDIKFTNYRFFWTTTALAAQMPTASGPILVTLKSSKTDSDAIHAFAQGAAFMLATYQGRSPEFQPVPGPSFTFTNLMLP